MNNNYINARRLQIETPFTLEQLAHFKTLIPADEQAQVNCITTIVAAARRYCITKHSADITKTQARDELQALLTTTHMLRNQLISLGVGARVALEKNFSLNGGDELDCFCHEYMAETLIDVEMFIEFQRGAIDVAASNASSGRIANTALRNFKSACWEAYETATGRKRGVWQFFQSVCEPLGKEGWLRSDLCDGEREVWQKSWENAVRVRSKSNSAKPPKK